MDNPAVDFNLSKVVPTRSIVEIVEAQNQTLTEFSHEIAAAIRSLQS